MTKSSYSYENSAVRLRVYDMDGTLANTENVADGRRLPFDLLSGSPMTSWFGNSGYLPSIWPEGDPNFGLPRITRSGFNMSHAPAIDIVSGVPVALITRAPVAYASTLAGLLGLERYPIWASSRLSRAEKLAALAKMFRVEPGAVVYVGDQNEDRQAADEAGCKFEVPDEVVRPALGEPLYAEDWWPEPLPSTTQAIAHLADSPLTTVSDIVRSLRVQPLHERTFLQARLARLVHPEHRYCLVPPGRLVEHLFDYPGVPAYLFAKQEHDETYLLFLRNLFPARPAPAPDTRGGDTHYFVKFRNSYQSGQQGADPLGRLMSEIKDYRTRNGRVRSGSEVQFGGLRLVADVMAAHLVDWFRDYNPPLIDFVRPNEFSEEQPGQTSTWLAEWIAEACTFATGVPWGLSHGGEDPWSVLIDDQRTSGRHLADHLQVSGERQATMTWSWSQSEVQTGPAPHYRRGSSECFWPDGGPCPMHDFADPVFGEDFGRPTPPGVASF